MDEYVQKMDIMDISRGYLVHTEEIDEPMLSRVMFVNGQTGWLGNNGRSNVAAGHSITAGQHKDKKPDLVTS